MKKITDNPPSILLVEDDPAIVWLVKEILGAADYQVHTVSNGNLAVEFFQANRADLVILDLRLPGLDGLSVCREIRRNSYVPILIVSAQDRELDKVIGLEVGADDYMTKPFHPDELLARVRAQLRRSQWPSSPPETGLRFGTLHINHANREAEIQGQPVALTTTEFGILYALAKVPGQVLSRQQLLDEVWGPEFATEERTVDAHVRNLRAKLRAADGAAWVQSVRGVGYKFAG